MKESKIMTYKFSMFTVIPLSTYSFCATDH